MEKSKDDPVDLEIIVRDEPAGHKIELRLWLRLLSTTNMITQEIRQRLRAEFAITLPQFDLLAQLDRERDGLRMGDLSKRMMVSNGNVTGLIERLETDKLIVRDFDPVDRRVIVAKLTPLGIAKFRTYSKAHEGWLADMFADVDPATAKALMKHMATMKASVGAHLTRDA
jgi:DNA-binding MarR family transcriptional regulator